MDGGTMTEEKHHNVATTSVGNSNVGVQPQPRESVDESETVRPVVLWQRENRTYTDKLWAILYILSYIAFLSTGFVLVANSQPRYERDDESDVKVVSSHFRSDVQKCCQEIEGENRDFVYDLCDQLEPSNERRLRAGESKFDGDEGIFDAFLEAPEIIVGLLGLTVFLAISWVVLLRFCARPIVIVTELIKVGVFVYMGVASQVVGTAVICFLIAVGILAYDYWFRNDILFAAKIIAQAAVAFKENPSMFVGIIFVMLLYVLNAYLFVLFFSEGFEVVEVKPKRYCYSGDDECYSSCEFVYPDYVYRITTYLCLAYLWTVLLFAKMRLSVVANVVGSWHFHPENKPSIFRALLNTTSTSFGTLTVSSLISTIAERINRILQEPWWRSWIGPAACVTLPLQLLLCVFGSCIEALVRMLTKFAVILHVFTGLPFVGAAKKVFKIMTRHFRGGFITEVTSQGVLYFGAYVFSIGLAFLSWVWFDRKFDCDTFPGGDDATYAILWILLGLFNLWYPVLGIYIIIIINRALQSWETSQREESDDNYQHIWVSPLAAIFVGCIAMMFFTYLASIFLDTVDVLFVCFAIDKDNSVDVSNQEFMTLVESMTGTIQDDTDSEPTRGGIEENDLKIIPVAVPLGAATDIKVY